MTAVAVFDHKPSPRELLDYRLTRGWRPTPSRLKAGEQVLGYAACVFTVPELKDKQRPAHPDA